MTIQRSWIEFVGFLNGGTLYLAMLLGRGVFISFPILLAVLLLRRTALKKTVFLKGMLWLLFLPLPFIGKMRFFYESSMGVRLFIWWHNLCIRQQWVCWIYLLGMLVFSIYIWYRRRKLYRFVTGLPRETCNGMEISICDKAVTPFTAGVFRPRIVVPEVMRKDFRREDLQTILLHEKSHIRLGHLWFYVVWDILRVLLWVNPLLTVCTRYLREDLEEICDRVAIQKSRGTAYDYGRLLLNSIRILGDEPVDTSVAFAGEQEYQSIKNRMEKVAHFKPYGKSEAVISLLSCILIVSGLFFGVRQLSYPVYMERTNISICDMRFQLWEIGNQAQLQDVISFKNGCVYIHRDAWQEVLREQGIEDDTYYVGFGGYLKLPGIGGGGNAVYVDAEEEAELLVIPYYDNDAVLWTRLFKLL